MKKTRSMFLIAFVLFFMTGCNGTTSEVLPSLGLIGESIVEVEQYSEFVDPGVEIIGDFDLDVDIESNVDTNIIGDYTITYTITYLGIDYDINRTVRVVEIGSEITPDIQLSGESTIEVEQYTEFIDPGVDLIGDLELNVIIESDLNVDVIGTYTITYIVTYNEIDYSVSRTVNVIAATIVIIPTITLVGDSIIELEQYTTYVESGVTITDDLGLTVLIVGEVDTTTIGSYTLTYTITYNEIDYSVTRTVNVVAPTIVVTPTITLIGDAVMQVEQDTVFVDPGVTVTGNLGLDIVVDSDLDMSLEGTYTITYTVTYMDIEYSVTRSVEVVFEVVVIPPDLFVITITEDSVTGRSATVVVTVDDTNSVISNGVVNIYKEDILQESIPFINGVNNITFNDLDDNTTYTIKVEGDYLNSDSKPQTLYGYDLDITTMASGELSFDIGELVVSTYSIEFSIVITDEDEKLTDLAVKILDGDTIIESIELFDDILDGEIGDGFVFVNFDGLDELTNYTIEISYSYLPVGETIAIEAPISSLDYTTLESVVPEILSHEVNERYYSLNGELILDLTDYEGYYIWARLYKSDVFEETTTLSDGYTTYEFDYLDGNTEYRIDFYADFTITSTGETHEGVFIGSFTATTLEQGVLTPPTIENVTVSHTPGSITVEFDVIDVDSAMERGIVFLYRGTSSYGNYDYVKGHNTITFESNLYENTLYTINFKADYTGNGSYVSIFEEGVYIPPVITVRTFEQNDLFFSGDNLVMRLELANDEDVAITAVTVNGERFSTFKFPSDTETLYVDLGVKLTGSYPINLQNIIITFNGDEYIIEDSASTDVTVYIPGSIAPENANVVVIDIVPQENFVVVDRDNSDATTDVIVDVYLENDYNLNVTGIKIGGYQYSESDITIISSTHIQITAKIAYTNSSNTSSNSLYYENITYEKNTETFVVSSGSHVNAYIYRIYDFNNNGTSSDNVVHLSTPEDLMAIDPNSSTTIVYILDNDIDMTGYVWTPIGNYDDQFNGAFNGNGYTISNVTITETLAEGAELKYIGFFGYTNAFIADLTIENITITVHSDPSNYIYVGGLAGKSLSDIVNVHVTNSSITVDGVIVGAIGGLVGAQRADLIRSSANTDIINVTVTDETSNMRLYVGGLVGDKSYEDVRRSYATGDITISISSFQTLFVGGLLGTSSGEGSMISNSYATGNINVTTDYYSRTGGLIGNSFSSLIDNSFASGNVHASAGTLGGLVGESNGYVSSSFATGTVSCDSGFAGRIFGDGNNYKLLTMFAYDNQITTNGGTPTLGADYYYSHLGEASATQFNDTWYYTDFLGWSSHFYDFSSLDIVSGDLPTSNISE